MTTQIPELSAFEEEIKKYPHCLAFEFRTQDGHEYKIYLDGRHEGFDFPDGTVMANHAAPLFSVLRALLRRNGISV